MRFQKFVASIAAAALLGIPAAVVTAAPAAAVGEVATKIGIARAPARQLFNNPVQVGAVLTTTDPTPVAIEGQSLHLERKIAGHTTYSRIATLVTDADGKVVFTTNAVSNAYYKVTFDQVDSQYLASSSSSVRVKVARNLGAKQKPLGGPKFRFYGKVRPQYARHQVVLQRKIGAGRWKIIGTQRTTSTSRWSFVVFARKTKGVVRYRTYTPRSTLFIKSYSATFKITTI